MPMLQFAPIHSFVDSSFFTKLSDLKLNHLRLDSSRVDILGNTNFRSLQPQQPPSLNLSSSSFESRESYEEALPLRSNFFQQGHVYNVNTIEEFKSTDKAKFLRDAGMEILAHIQDGSALQSTVTPFSVLVFSDLKKYKFYYWLAFPALASEWTYEKQSVDEELINAIQQRDDLPELFLFNGSQIQPLLTLQSTHGSVTHSSSSTLRDITVGFVDTSSIDGVPSWNLRNYLFLLATYGYTRVNVCIHRANPKASFMLRLSLNEASFDPTNVKVTGWERTSQNKLGPKVADLGSLIDPIQLADQAVDLNLKLMKWRIAPELDLDVMKATKCLLLGAGTLGSYVSRALLGWGFRDITLVDNGKVSFSNPVRQPLFEFADCVDGGKPKAEAAAAALKRIFPLANAQGYELEVPMVGHPLTNEATQERDYKTLVDLIEAHDVIFLLMDSRETRWLPTIIGNVKQKIVINAALGFDSYLVMRHGSFRNEETERLGCYFCNDVVAPNDSLTDRTLDQMCTVTRPGVAMIASALAVEVLVSLLQHKDRQYTTNGQTILGAVPHQIRGFLHSFENIKLTTANYPHCSACSVPILQKYEQEGWDFVKTCLNNYKYVEDVSGLTEVQRQAEAAVLAMEELNLSDDDDSEWR
ncbi:hypothetical protein BABINDRAFT_160845 [Babjeviella inositovora NRRL Y-12698]|uniref:Ubiquitin-like modifier-activating enzyme ATG7 n=1 Tax=Babjeviella inositovora NRRL Y-12698 TaxID=984486 RepID=A0A1E3QSA5_9ASCO|nr:uncharacterized protein BABINDRAFT_160845 [Babjeviella inositovora NRRL Y-12698]ODQ80585.1 hypothetical protein BABINDRAFT_160845 [Babjeviella inositovora NRRL Y-12698]